MNGFWVNPVCGHLIGSVYYHDAVRMDHPEGLKCSTCNYPQGPNVYSAQWVQCRWNKDKL